MISLETTRLVLRQIVPEDAIFLVGLLNEPSFIKNIGDRGIRNAMDAEQYIQNGPAASYKKNGFGLYLVSLKNSGDAIGMCGLIKRDYLEEADLGYAYLPAFWRQGYAFEAAGSVLSYAKDPLGLKQLAAIVNPENMPSIQLLKKLGFNFEKMIRVPGQDRDIQKFLCPLQGYNPKILKKGDL